MAKSIDELASLVGGVVEGDGSTMLQSVAGLREAAPGDLSFLSNAKYGKLLSQTRASAVLVGRDWQGETGATLVRVDNPDVAFTKATEFFRPPPVICTPGIHATATIDETASLGVDVHVGANAVISAGAVIGDRCVIQAGSFIGEQASLGEDCEIRAGAVVREHVILGDRVIVHNNSVIGSDGFGYTVDDKGVRTKVPQVGTVRVGNDVEIGACVCIDRARFGETRIGNGVKIDNLVQIAHNVIVGDNVVLVAQVGISGSTVVEPHAILAGQVGVAGHLTIGKGAVVGAQGGVTKDVPPGTYVWGTPAVPFEKVSRNISNLNRYPKLQARVEALEAQIRELRGDLDG